MQVNKDNKKDYLIHCLAILIITMLCLINFEKYNYLVILNDEFGYWANAASFMGYDWKELIAETPYYSWGYSIWLMPIIGLLPTPELWYKAAISLNILFLIGSYFLCCKTGKMLFRNIENSIVYAVSFVTIIYPSNIFYAQLTWSETLLYFLMWLATYLIVILENKFSYKKITMTAIILIYMYIVHARAIGVVLVGIVALFFVFLKHKKHPLEFLSVFLLLGIGLILHGEIKDYHTSILWANSEASNLNNVGLDTGTISYYLSQITNNIRLLAESLGGKLIYLIVATGLTLPVAVVQFIKELILAIKSKEWFFDNIITKFWCICSCVAMWGICALQMMSWSVRKDMIVYSRYMENALGPILFLSLMYMIIKKKELRIGISLSIVLFFTGLRSVYLRVSRTTGNFNSVCSPVFGAFYDNCDKDAMLAFVCMVISLLAIFVVLWGGSHLKNKEVKKSIIVVVFSVYFIIVGYCSSTYINDARDYYKNNTESLAISIQENYGQSEIYYIKNQELDWYSVNPKYLQFILHDKSIQVMEIEKITSCVRKGDVVLINPYDIKAEEEIIFNQKLKLVSETEILKMYIVQ